MRIISFAWTTPAITADPCRKTCTRREWDDGYARKFLAGDLIAAWDRSPRFGGKHVATIRLTVKPYLEPAADIPDDDWQAEGFDFLTEIGAKLDGHSPRVHWDAWKADPLLALWVVRFERIALITPGTVPHSEPSAQARLF